jgi:hypothetical protein
LLTKSETLDDIAMIYADAQRTMKALAAGVTD